MIDTKLIIIGQFHFTWLYSNKFETILKIKYGQKPVVHICIDAYNNLTSITCQILHYSLIMIFESIN